MNNRGVRETPSPDEWPPGKGQHTTGFEKTSLGSDESPVIQVQGHEVAAGTALHRGLKARHITMIAIGGAIGTGLIIGTGAALARAGPGSIFIAYTAVGFVSVFTIYDASLC